MTTTKLLGWTLVIGLIITVFITTREIHKLKIENESIKNNPAIVESALVQLSQFKLETKTRCDRLLLETDKRIKTISGSGFKVESYLLYPLTGLDSK